MKTYPANLFGAWPGDQGPEGLPGDARTQTLFPALHAEAVASLAWIGSAVKGIRQSDEEAALDGIYRRGHVLYGLTAILRIPKAAHLLALLDFALDCARSLETFERYSLRYVISLLLETTGGVFEEFHRVRRSERDIADSIEECANYLREPFQLNQSPPSRPLLEPPPVAAPGSSVLAPAAVPAAAPRPFAPTEGAGGEGADLDDGPEVLDIPANKVGLISDFCEECRDSLTQVGRRLIELEDAAEPLPIVNDVFRFVHTIKGGARLMKVRKMEALAHRAESLLDQVRKGARAVNSALIDALLEASKLLGAMTDEVALRGPIRTRVRPLLEALERLESGRAPAVAVAAPTPAVEKAAPVRTEAAGTRVADSIRVPTEKLDEVLNTASEIFISRIRLQSDVAAFTAAIHQFRQALHAVNELDADAILGRLAEANRRLLHELRDPRPPRPRPPLMEPSPRPPEKPSRALPDRLRAQVNRFHDELAAEIGEHELSPAEELTFSALSIDEVRKRLQKNVEHLDQLSSRLQAGAMSFRMVPIAHLFERFPTQVREVAREVGKKVKLDISGEDTELDKVLINQLGDPLLHLLRNAIDHGIEPPDQRREQGKAETGHITLSAYYEGSHAVIEVRDDGRGIDTAKVLARAVANGLADSARAASLTRQEILEFIFAPGFSTAEQVSKLSGRGVGMDVVKTAISRLQGTITIDTVPGEGTVIRLKLPLTLAVVGILLVKEQTHLFALPIQHVDEILSVAKAEIRCVSGRWMFNHRGATLPVTSLSNLLEFPPSPFADSMLSLVILSEGEKKLGILVDGVLGRQEVLIKNLGTLIKKAPFVMGCTILSDSRLVLVLNAWEVVNTGAQHSRTQAAREGGQVQQARRLRSILVVDDSAIQRKNLGALLSQAGYTVETAENGFEAIKRLRQRRYAAYCVDIVMPLMDGFEFVERLRRLPGHLDSPVFFVTNRTAQAERDRAANLGVKDYFQKPVDVGLLVQALDKHCLE